MSKYTTEVRYICETYAGLNHSVNGNDVESVITQALPHIFNFNFPIFDEQYREILEKKIIRHYYTREIGYETVGLWKLKLNTKLNEIMPYYNQLYESTLLEFNPLYTHELHTIRGNTRTDNRGKSDANTRTLMTDVTNTRTNNTTDTTTKVDTHYNLQSDTPQGGLTGIDEETYMSYAEKNTANDTDTLRKTGTITDVKQDRGTIGDSRQIKENAKTVDEYTDYVYGYEGANLNKLLKDFRENMINVDLMIINDLNKLFMGLW